MTSYSDAEKIAYYKKRAFEAERALLAGSSARLGPGKPLVAPKKRAAPRKRKATTTRTRREDRYTDGAIGEMVGGGIGAAIAGGPGALIGGALGKGAHKMFKQLTGFGDYTVAENSLMLASGGMSPPMIVNSIRGGGFIVRHREYIKDIRASTSFTVETFPINPGIINTFPWLSQIAGSFEQYRLRGAVFEFKSLSSDAVLSTATSSALGAVIMATDYNVLGAPFANKMEMENYEYACSAKPSCSFLHPVECKRSLTPVSELYVRTTAVPSNADARLYDLGLFQIATTGMQAAAGVAGELWLTYEVELLKPKINTQEVVADHFVFQGTVAGATPLGSTTAELQNGSNLGGAIIGNTYIFPVGVIQKRLYLFEYVNHSTTPVAITAPLITGTNCAVQNFYNGGGVSINNSPENAVTAGNFTATFCIEIDVTSIVFGDTYVTWGAAGTIPDGDTARDLVITELAPEMD
jgi:hypothetical protein